jgi:hypothetical protein
MRRLVVPFLTGLIAVAAVVAQDAPADAKIAGLIRQLGAGRFEQRAAAARALIKIGEPARPPLERAAREDANAEVRRRADDVLHQLNRRRAAAILQARIEAARAQAEQVRAARKQARALLFDPAKLPPVVEKQGALPASETWTAQKTYRITGYLTVPVYDPDHRGGHGGTGG